MRDALRRTCSRCVNVVAPVGMLALLFGLASTAALVAATPVAAVSGGVNVFVGYADSFHAFGEFPNPWAGTPKVTFDGCTPASACTFDAGAVRIENDGAVSVAIDQVGVHIGACLYTWSGPLYPVVLQPGASLITTQRGSGAASGCTGPDPSTFDSSDIPSPGICTNDGIEPMVDVTVDGVTTSHTDSGQVLNSGGVDPGSCTGTNESTEWVGIGNRACPGQTLSLEPAGQTHPIGTTATVTATYSNACGSPLSGVLVSIGATAGPNAGVNGSGLTDPNGSTSFSYSSLIPGTDTLDATVTNAAGFTATSNSVSVNWTVEFAPGGGSFVIGDRNAVIGGAVNFWGSQWSKRNSLSGGPAPRSFKGFAEAPDVPQCGQSWATDPGNSTPPPDGPLPALMAVIVTSSSHQSGSTIAGDIVEIVIVRTNAGYEPDPGHSATGTVVAVVCGSHTSGAGTSASPSHSAPASVPTAPNNPDQTSTPARNRPVKHVSTSATPGKLRHPPAQGTQRQQIRS